MAVVLVTGSCGLIGSEVVSHFDQQGWQVIGIDNNMRRDFFGEEGDVTRNKRRLLSVCRNYRHHDLDIRERSHILDLVQAARPDLVVHAAAQPSHDLAASRPFDDFDINAAGTLNLLEAARRHCPAAVFVHLSTNKVYGDAPNRIPLVERATRWDYSSPDFADGIDEHMSIDQSMHSIFGASKVAADVMVQEYGRYFGMRTCCLRCGCLTGASHAGVRLHGFLSYLIRCNLQEREYTIYGHKGKQVRDNIHACDVARFISFFYANPSPGAIFNLGGGRANSISIVEAFDRVQQITGKPMRYRYADEPRRGDHICYISNLALARNTFPGWDVTISLNDIFLDLVTGWERHLNS